MSGPVYPRFPLEGVPEIPPPSTILPSLSWDHPAADPMADMKAAFERMRPEPSMTWTEVQMLLIAILRQVEDNKIQFHRSELEASGCTLFQTTDEATGMVTMWFEKEDTPQPCGNVRTANGHTYVCNAIPTESVPHVIHQYKTPTGDRNLRWQDDSPAVWVVDGK